MKKRLKAKIQKLTSKMPPQTTTASNVLVIEADDATLAKRKGTLYALFDISSELEVDSLLVTKMVNDVLHDTYFHSENISPIQSLEKATVAVRDNITRLVRESSKTQEIPLNFNILLAALWGNVLYLVQYGNGGSFLVRDGAIKPINVASEGNFSVASGVIKDNDVAVIGTNAFVTKYPPEKLLNLDKPILSGDLSLDSAALILKFVVDTKFSNEELVDFGASADPEVVKPSKSRFKLPKLKWFKSKVAKKELNPLPEQNTSSADLSSFPPIGGINYSPISKRPRKFKNLLILLIPVLALMLGVSAYMSLNDDSASNDATNNSSFIDPASLAPAENSGETTVDDQLVSDEITELFYDVKITDSFAEPTSIAVLENNVVVADSNTGAVYFSALETPKFAKNDSSFVGINLLGFYDENLALIDTEGFKVYDITADSVNESYSAPNLELAATYLEFVYGISGSTITKYTKETDTLSSEVWANDSDLENAVSMAIDGSIYVLKNDGSLLSYTQGAQDTFEITGLDTSFSNPVQVVTNVDLNSLYIADKGNNRIVVLNKNGATERVLESPLWNDIKSIGVSIDETKLYVLSGSKVYETALVEEENTAE